MHWLIFSSAWAMNCTRNIRVSFLCKKENTDGCKQHMQSIFANGFELFLVMVPR